MCALVQGHAVIPSITIYANGVQKKTDDMSLMTDLKVNDGQLVQPNVMRFFQSRCLEGDDAVAYFVTLQFEEETSRKTTHGYRGVDRYHHRVHHHGHHSGAENGGPYGCTCRTYRARKSGR
jgi:hypothetical protein